MPFTLSHPAAVVPLARGHLVLSALVIGSLMPDVPYFIPGLNHTHFGHTPAGLIYFCLPAGLFLLWLFQRFLKLPLLSLFPLSHQQRLIAVAGPFRFGPLPRLGWIILSLFLGALSHILWDWVTHSHGWAVQHVPFLQTLLWGPFRIYLVLQYGSSIGGMIMLLYWYWRWFQQAPVCPLQPQFHLSPRTKSVCWATVLTGPLVLLGTLGYLHLPATHNIRRLENSAQNATIMALCLFAVELLLFSLLWHGLQSYSRMPAKR